MADPRPFQPVIVVWEDAHTESTDQHDSPELAVAAYTPAIRRTIGYWCGRNEKVVVLATDDDRHIGSASKLSVGGTSYIPAGMVQRVEILGVDAKPVRRRK